MAKHQDNNATPVIGDRKDFNLTSGNAVERLIFNNRLFFVVLCTCLTFVLGYQALGLRVNASFERMMPSSHEFIRNYMENKQDLAALGNSVRVMVENPNGTIFDPEYLQVLQEINDKINLAPGVDRAWMRSLWMPAVRWNEVTEVGMEGGPVMPNSYDGSAASLQELQVNVLRGNLIGDLVSLDMRSSVIVVPLMDKDPLTGEPFDYNQFAQFLEKDIRGKYEVAGSDGQPKVRVHIIGFAKLVGDLIDGLTLVMGFFAVAALIVASIIYGYTRCLRSSVLLVVASLSSVIWLLGLMQLLDYDIDPYSILVPFLIFAIGMSHGAQKMNGIMQDIGRGTDRYVAARYTFRRLFVAGLTALLANVFGFAILMVIDIPVIRDLAITTSIGVFVLIFTQLIMVPVMLSYIGVSPSAALRSVRNEQERTEHGGFFKLVNDTLVKCTQPGISHGLVILALIVGYCAFDIRRDLQIGDLDAGAPELRAESRYNQDLAFFNSSFGRSTDQFAVIVKTKPGECSTFETLTEIDRLSRMLRDVPGVQSVVSLSSSVRFINSSYGEANPKWMSIPRVSEVAAQTAQLAVMQSPELANLTCSISPVVAYLADHRADTLQRVVTAVEAFASKHNTEDRQFLLAAGPAGIEAATNQVVESATLTVLLLLYASVVVLCLIAFRSWRAVIVALVPLVITSLLCEAIMVQMGIGVKVATLPVIALGVGAGVDYALYLLSVQLTLQRKGATLEEAYSGALRFTGKVVALVGLTLAAGVLTWVFSPIKFQADMGILLTFMFLWNMIGALVLIPALSHLLLRGQTRPVPVQTSSALEPELQRL
ncbi:efflux RND transporter permease subunit [Pseudomonas sp. TTU2014-080ASC]|uniref:efflux RND transporter permease subunit n=1 Tax=Pseudomonas sp. TTU2014-080ASC TaxID=1729724 RepID=UPI00071899A4|nr:MMPL family transporter [Pseudomonas sp. TTU2014-080ASC]KRW57576.1 RND transporter [Pseudomonas sp. TTU2014-080ASC]